MQRPVHCQSDPGAITASLILRTSLPWPAWTGTLASALQVLAGDGAGRLLSFDCLVGSQAALWRCTRCFATDVHVSWTGLFEYWSPPNRWLAYKSLCSRFFFLMIQTKAANYQKFLVLVFETH